MARNMEKKSHILVVDDSISMCKSLSLILKHNGYAVITALNGLEAIERVREMPFDVIFMDIKMPVMDGVETYRKIKQIRLDPVVIMITAYSVQDLIDEALKEGAYSVLYKPLDMEKVLGILVEILESKQSGDFADTIMP